jgi:hypothetical protein
MDEEQALEKKGYFRARTYPENKDAYYRHYCEKENSSSCPYSITENSAW